MSATRPIACGQLPRLVQLARCSMYPQQLSAPPRRTAALAARARSAPVRLPAAKPTRGNRRQPNLAVRASAAATEPPAAKGDVGSNKLGYFTSNPRADVLAGVTGGHAYLPPSSYSARKAQQVAQ